MSPTSAVTSTVPALPPSDAEVGRLLVSVRKRIVRLVRHHGINLDDGGEEEHAADPSLLDSEVLAQALDLQ